MKTAAALSKAMGSGFGGSDSRDLLAGNHAAAEAARTAKALLAADAAFVLASWEIWVSEVGSMEFRNPGDWSQAASVWPEFRKDGSVIVSGNASQTCVYPVSVFQAAAIMRAEANRAAREAQGADEEAKEKARQAEEDERSWGNLPAGYSSRTGGEW